MPHNPRSPEQLEARARIDKELAEAAPGKQEGTLHEWRKIDSYTLFCDHCGFISCPTIYYARSNP